MIKLSLEDINPIWKKFREFVPEINKAELHAEYCQWIETHAKRNDFHGALAWILDGIKFINS